MANAGQRMCRYPVPKWRLSTRDDRKHLSAEHDYHANSANTSAARSIPMPLRYTPWLEFASLLVVSLCVVASVIIISLSANQAVESWRIQPSVLLNLLNSFSNVALGTAFSAGVANTWWTSATGGATLSQLHYIWDRGGGFSFPSAIRAGGNAEKVALTTAVIAVVKLSTGPLLQKATHQAIQNIVAQETMLLNVVQILPEGWTGQISNASLQSSFLNSQGLATAQAWWRNDTIHTLDAPGYYCDGTCKGNVSGGGIGYNCSSTTQALDLYMGHGTIIFTINTTITQDSTGMPFLLLTTLYSSAVDDTCTATLTIDSCKIQAGTVEYPIVIRNSTVALDSTKLNNVTLLSTYHYPGDLPTALPGSPAGTLEGLNEFTGNNLRTQAQELDPLSYDTNLGMLADMFYNADASSYDNFTFNTCHLTWSSPTSYVLTSMQDFLFRAALRASTGTDVQSFKVQRTKSTLVFHSDYKYLAVASFIALLGPFFILFRLPWSSLGRTVSLSPLEIARAFPSLAPHITERAGDHFTAKGILEVVGPIGVRYVNGEMTVINNRDIEEGQNHEAVEVQARDDGNANDHFDGYELYKVP